MRTDDALAMDLPRGVLIAQRLLRLSGKKQTLKKRPQVTGARKHAKRSVLRMTRPIGSVVQNLCVDGVLRIENNCVRGSVNISSATLSVGDNRISAQTTINARNDLV